VQSAREGGGYPFSDTWVRVAPFLWSWAIVGGFQIICSSYVALKADQLAHVQRQNVLMKTFEEALNFSAAQLKDLHSGQLVKIIMQGVDVLWAIWLGFFRDHMSSFFALIILLPVTFYLNWRMAWLLFMLCLVFAGLSYFVLNKTYKLQKVVQTDHNALAERLSDTLGNTAVVQSFVRVNAEVRELKQISDHLLAAQLPILSWWAIVNVLTRLGTTIALIFMLMLGVLLFESSLTTVGEIVTFISIAVMVVSRLQQTVQFVINLADDRAKLQDFFSLSSLEGKIQISPQPVVLERIKGRIEFKNVCFSYDGSKKILDHMSFVIEPGQKVALVGVSGVGKSTVLKLLMREYDAQSGSILIDGVDIRSLALDSLRENIGVVFQETMLFDRSISKNLRMGNPLASEENLVRASKAAQAFDFITSYPESFETRIGERGRKLSGGERQRIALARVLLKNPPILVLDEATNALDHQTESNLSKAFEEAMCARTALIITHRLESLLKVDLIYVMSEGSICESGNYQSLMNEGGLLVQLASDKSASRPHIDLT
jgi:ATP-binding cassette subfamily B protein